MSRILLLLLLLELPLLASSAAAGRAVADATGAALQADTSRALVFLRGVPAAEFDGKDAEFRACMLDRFGSAGVDRPPDAPPASFASRVLAVYRSYWRAASSRPAERAQAETALLGSLSELLRNGALHKVPDAERLIARELRSEGYYSLQGMTGVLRELMVWKKQDERNYVVQLPDGDHKARVVLLDEFLSLGWSDYTTCGRRSTGGWAKPDALYAVVPRYASLDDEKFRVSFLAHEAQHSVDRARFRGIRSWELEYRAKLTELALAIETRGNILQRLMEDQGDSPDSPHSYSNKRVIAALGRRLGGRDPGTVEAAPFREAAIAELVEDTKRRTGHQAPARP
jgi:hypothetical protein